MRSGAAFLTCPALPAAADRTIVQRGGLTLFLLFASLLVCGAQRQAEQRPPPLDPVQGKSEARVLVAELLAQKPAHDSTNSGRVRIRARDGSVREIPARFEIACTPTNWLSIYETLSPKGGAGGVWLLVIHADDQPNQYQLAERTDSGSRNPVPRKLTPAQAMVPFAGSDFWVADLGLEFLYWPEQRLLRKEMRHSKSCGMLESTNPQPAPGGYARVVSWITLESPHGIIHADAYDLQNKVIKEFDPVNLEKVNGTYQLEEVEMRNRQTGSHTWIKFEVAPE